MLKKTAIIAIVAFFVSAKAYCTELYICNECEYTMQFAIVYKHGFGILADNYSTAGYYTLAPGDCKKIKYGWGSVIGKGYLRFSFRINGKYETPNYSLRNSSRRSKEAATIEADDWHFCLPSSSLGHTVSWKNLHACSTGKVHFNLFYFHESSVNEFTIYATDTSIQTSFKSSVTR